MNPFVYVVEAQVMVDEKPVAGLFELVSVHESFDGATAMMTLMDSSGVRKPMRKREVVLRK
jgi:hypothetical protein